MNQTVAPAQVETPSPKPVGATAQPVQGVDVSISVSSVKLAATVPGDVSGPGVLVKVTIHNTSDQPLPVGQTVVNIFGANGDPAVNFAGAPTKPFTGTLAPGKTATASYAAGLDAAQRSKVRIEVRGNPSMGIAVYEGAVRG